MDNINELEVRDLLQNDLQPEMRLERVLHMLESSRSWDEKRPLWFFLFNTLHEDKLTELFQNSLLRKQRVPFDILIEMLSRSGLELPEIVVESIWKGLRKQHAHEDILNARGLDRHEPKFSRMRNELVNKMLEAHKSFRGHMLEKFEFLKNQRMTDQAGRVLKRMIELFPLDEDLRGFKREFDEEWAREILANHAAKYDQGPGFERTHTSPSSADQQMLQCFLIEGESLTIDHRGFALDLAMALKFLEDYNRALQILPWAPAGPSADWLKAESLFEARRFVEAVDHLNQLEIKYIESPETTFSVSYLRAQCLFELGQQATALEMMRSLVRVRPNYRSANALILEWTAGAGWE